MKKSNHQAGLCGECEWAGQNADHLGNSIGIGEYISAAKFKLNQDQIILLVSGKAYLLQYFKSIKQEL